MAGHVMTEVPMHEVELKDKPSQMPYGHLGTQAVPYCCSAWFIYGFYTGPGYVNEIKNQTRPIFAITNDSQLKDKAVTDALDAAGMYKLATFKSSHNDGTSCQLWATKAVEAEGKPAPANGRLMTERDEARRANETLVKQVAELTSKKTELQTEITELKHKLALKRTRRLGRIGTLAKRPSRKRPGETT